MIDSYLTISKLSVGEYREKGSKFLAYLIPADSSDRIADNIRELKKSHPKARHYCTASRILMGETLEERSDDDGEPSGTAGKPILHQLQKQELLNAICIVVRYFGGTKLGKPGLARAYRDAAEDSISKAEFVRVRRLLQFKVIMPYTLQPGAMEAMNKLNISLLNEVYSANSVSFTIGLNPLNSKEMMEEFLKETTHHERDTVEDYLNEFGLELEELSEKAHITEQV